MRTAVLLLSILLLAGCQQAGTRPFQLKNLAKSDIDTVADTHRRQLQAHLRTLAVKLYKRNPRELGKEPGQTIHSRLQQLFQAPRGSGFAELQQLDGNAALRLAFAEEFNGDRVFALMAGLTGMLNASYNHRQEFFLLDTLDQQKLYNSARNLETVAWQLRQRHTPQGEPLLLTNGVDAGGVANYSYERLFGKMISLQDTMAIIISQTTNRAITRVVHSAASMTLLPI